ncbi:hypothetical protein [Apis mellifera associated microvirus 57]|nr:hypothetical protein [Apis mellifera associated microvirus 57]
MYIITHIGDKMNKRKARKLKAGYFRKHANKTNIVNTGVITKRGGFRF